ncbi:hypothetical protein HDV04_000447 [Boothiomyces sp. JEL0838]|nr:hypothetical protein HDV04_000447 [Boothiomyces sp. JEL0838]
MEDAGIDVTAAEWIQHKARREEERLREYTVVPTLLKPKNFGIIREKDLLINRIEVASNLDFKTILQIMVGEPEIYPHKEGFLYTNVLLMTEDTSRPYLIPYLYEGTLNKKNGGSQNNLKEWLFINSDLERVRHSVKHYVRE